MSLSDLIAARKDSASGLAAASTQSEGFPEGNDGVTEAEQPVGVAKVVTPAGLEIYYQAGPKRLYRLRHARVRGPMGWDSEDLCEWYEVPSVSKVLEVLEKGGLSWWGMKVGVEGVIQLTDDLYLELPAKEKWPDGRLSNHIIDLLKQHKLTVNHVRDNAADRGTNVHTALETFVNKKVMPDPDLFPENERGYVQGLVNFLNDANPVPFYSELMVASLDGYAGRFDLVANLDFAGDVVTKTYPKKKPIRSAISGVWLLDLKTSKDVYESYHLQIAAYRKAMVECGYPEVDHIGVVRVTDDGRYELVEGRATYSDFRSVLDTYHVIQGLK